MVQLIRPYLHPSLTVPHPPFIRVYYHAGAPRVWEYKKLQSHTHDAKLYLSQPTGNAGDVSQRRFYPDKELTYQNVWPVWHGDTFIGGPFATQAHNSNESWGSVVTGNQPNTGNQPKPTTLFDAHYLLRFHIALMKYHAY